MKLDNAIKLLGKYGSIEATPTAGRPEWHRYEIPLNNRFVSFVDTNDGKARFFRTRKDITRWEGESHPTLTAALRYALRRRAMVQVPMPDTHFDDMDHSKVLNLDLEVVLDHDGPALRPRAYFYLQTVNTPSGIVSLDLGCQEAVGLAEDVLAGKVSGVVLLDWLVDRSNDRRVYQVVLDFQAYASEKAKELRRQREEEAARLAALPRSWKVGVKTAGDTEWCSNGLRFKSKQAAASYGADLACRWTAVREWTVLPSDDEPNRA